MLFRGDRLYRLRVPGDTPASDFLSIIAYQVGTNAFIHYPDDRVGVSSCDRGALVANVDGGANVTASASAASLPRWLSMLS